MNTHEQDYNELIHYIIKAANEAAAARVAIAPKRSAELGTVPASAFGEGEGHPVVLQLGAPVLSYPDVMAADRRSPLLDPAG